MSSTLAPVPVVIFANHYRGAQDVVAHQHVGTEIVLVLRGRCRIRVRDAVLDAGPGEAVVLPATVPHDQTNDGEVETLYVEFTAPARSFSERSRIIAVPLASGAVTWLKHLVELEREALPPTVRSGLALALIGHLSHLEQRQQVHDALHPGVLTALQRLEEDLLEDLTMRDLAQTVGISASHLTALFREQLGCGPMAWQQKQRLNLACRLLRNPYLGVAEVAVSCGYPDTNYFSRLFRLRYGHSPTAWRAMHALPPLGG